MAIFHFRTKVISRGKGQSAIAAAAYRSGKELTNEQTGEVKSYSRRAERVTFEGVFAPSDAPEWAKDRQQLWNHVERFEKRKDSRLAREIEVALPHEMTDQQREFLLKDFIREQFTRKGLVVDAAIHAPEAGKDDRNYHAHLLITTRRVNAEGFEAKIDLTQKRTEQLEKWREEWAKLSNRHLERHGIEARIDHRSLAAQGIEREPTIHLGYAAKEMEARGAQSDRLDEFRAILQRNDAIRFSERMAQGQRDAPKAESAPAHAPATDAPHGNPAPSIPPARAPEFSGLAARPNDLAAETPQQKEARELRAKQMDARAELKAWQKLQRDELKKQLDKEFEAFRRQSRGAYRAAAGKAYADMGAQFKAEWKELYRTTPKEQRDEAKAALAAMQREALAARRKELFEHVRDVRAVSWETAQRVQSDARKLLRQEQKAQWQQLAGEQFNEWRDMAERREKEREANTRHDHGAFAPLGSMATMQTAAVEHLVARANAQQRAAQRTHDALGNAAHARKEPIARMAALGKEETKARGEVTAPHSPPPRADSPNKVEAAHAQRVASGKEYSAAFQEFLARQAAKPRNEGNVSERRHDREREGRGRERGGRGGGRER